MAIPFDDRPVLDLSFEGNVYPYLYDGWNGRQRGFIPILWSFIGVILKKEIRFHQIRNEQLQMGNDSISLADVTVLNGTYLAFIDGTGMSVKRMIWATAGVPFMYAKVNIYESANDVGHEETSLTMYTVFAPSTIALLIAGLLIFNLIWWLHKKLLPNANRGKHISLPGVQQRIIFHSLFSISQGVMLLAITLTIYYHSAYFQTDSIVIPSSRSTTLTELIDSLDSRQLLLDVPGAANAAVLQVFRNKVQYEENKALFWKRLKADPKTFTWVLEVDRIQRKLFFPSFPLSTVSISDAERVKYPGIGRIGLSTPYYIAMSRNLTSRRIVKTINSVILRLFREDQLDLWNAKSVDKLGNFFEEEEDEFSRVFYSSMSFTRLSIIFYVFIGFCCLGILICVLENIYKAYFDRYNYVRTVENRASRIIQRLAITN